TRAAPSFGWLAAGAAGVALSLYTYVASRLLAPLLLAGFVALFLPVLSRLPASRLAALLALVAVLALPVGLFAVSSRGLGPSQHVGLAPRSGGAEAASRFVANSLSYFGPGFLLTRGDPNLRHSVRGFGALLPHDLLFLLAGVAAAAIRRKPSDL